MDEQELHKVRFGKGFVAALDQSATWVSELPTRDISPGRGYHSAPPGGVPVHRHRTVNVECADRVGIPTIQFHHPAQLKDDLELRGVTG
jgi:hypothetical protein